MAGFRQTNVPPRPPNQAQADVESTSPNWFNVIIALVILAASTVVALIAAGALAHAAYELLQYGWHLID